jgi:uncharacterized protein YutE (UPF0331/DUF86 family)
MELNKERKDRYLSKMGFMIEKLYTLPDEIDSLEELEIDGVLYRVQTSIDAALDIVAMMVKDIGIDVDDDYENIEILVDKKVIDPKLGDEIKKLNGLRNAIAHKYDNLDIELILNNLEIVKEQLREFIDSIEGELS